jgi:hypothetical protein
MIIVGLFTKYFLILMVVQGLVVTFIDASSFKHAKMTAAARKARVLGLGSIVLGIGLFLLRKLT